MEKWLGLLISIMCVKFVYTGISPVHDLKAKLNSKLFGDDFLRNTPHNVLKHLDNSILKSTKNVTQNPQMEEKLYQISKDLVSAILSKLEIQDKITRITKEALEAPGKNKGITAIETRRILDYISRKLSVNILEITKKSTEPELHRLVYGLAQIAAEISIVSALKDITYAIALSKKQSVDLSLRRKRSVKDILTIKQTTNLPITKNTVYNVILNKSVITGVKPINSTTYSKTEILKILEKPYSVISRNARNSVQVLNTKPVIHLPTKGFLNQTALDMENAGINETASGSIIIDKTINGSYHLAPESQSLDVQDINLPNLSDDWLDTNYKSALNTDVAAEMEVDETEIENDSKSEKRAKQKLERLESKAKKAIIYAGDVAFLTAASVVAMRRALTASIEVHMSVTYAKNSMSNHQDLMMNLAKTAAQQAGKEAKSAASKSLACERVIKLAVKYTAQSHGAELNHVANRIIMDTLSLSTLAKSMAFVSSDIAINSLYQATDVKPPS